MTAMSIANDLNKSVVKVDNARLKVSSMINELMGKLCGSILIYDDNETILSIVESTINKNKLWKLSIKTARTSEEARKHVADGDIRVALIDFYVENGHTSEDICLLLKTKRIPIIIMTGSPNEEVVEFCRKEGIRLLPKPFSMTKLYSLLCDCLLETIPSVEA